MQIPHADSTTPKYEAIDVAFLGKPIHGVREQLEEKLLPAASLVLQNLKMWLKSSNMRFSLNAVKLHYLNPNELADLSISRFLHQNDGLIFSVIDTGLLIQLSDRFYGEKMSRITDTLSNSDVRFRERISMQLLTNIAPESMWKRVDSGFNAGMGLAVSFDLELEDMTGQVHLFLDHVMITTLIEELGLKQHKDLTEEFEQSLGAVPVVVNAILSKTQMALSDVLSLAPNDILPIELLNNVPVSIGNNVLFTGSVAELNGQLVLTINS